MSLGIIESLKQVIPEHLHSEVSRELANGWRLEEVRAKHTAIQIGKLNHERAVKSVEGLGQLKARIPLQAFHYWSQKEGKEAWGDKAFLKEFLRDNPELAITNQEKKTMVGGAKGLVDFTGAPIK
jgi:hypothetical protein